MSDFAHCCNGGDTVHPWVGYDEATCPLCEARSEIARLQAELAAALAPDGGRGVGAFRRCYDRIRPVYDAAVRVGKARSLARRSMSAGFQRELREAEDALDAALAADREKGVRGDADLPTKPEVTD